MSDKIILGYWAIRGRAQPIRHLLMYCGLQFEQKLYVSHDGFGKDMKEYGFDFPNLPYLIDGDLKFTETTAIARYIIKKSGKTELLGENPQEQALINNFNYAFNDIVFPIVGLFYNKKFEDLRTPYFYKAKQSFNKIEKFLTGKQFSIDHLTYVDFFIAEVSYFIEKLYPEEYTKFNGIQRIRDKIVNLPEVIAYYKRQGCVLTPFVAPQMCTIPFYWPGTQPTGPPPAPVSTRKQSQTQNSTIKTSSQQNSAQDTKQQNNEQVPEQKVASNPPPPEKVEQQPKYYPPPAEEEFYVPQSGALKLCIISGSISGNSPVNYFLGKLSAFGHPAFQYEWTDISSLQLHNEDIDENGTQNVNNLRGQVYGADGVLIGLSATHNGLSTVLTNAYNWLTPVLISKPVGLVSIECPNEVQDSFRATLKKQNIPFLEQIHYGVPQSQTFFDEEGEISEPNWNQVKGYFNCLAKFIEHQKSLE